MPTKILEHGNTLEECYEFMLAYAAQARSSDESEKPGAQIRQFLQRAATAIAGLAEECTKAIDEQRLEPVQEFRSFFAVVDRDAASSLASIELVLAQPSISSQLVDNLNASIHLRALLTDTFLLGEVLRSQLASKPIR